MQDRYAADHVDFLKWALLRHVVAETGLALGVNWYWTDPVQVDAETAANDGKKTSYLLDRTDWRRQLDGELFAQLVELVGG